MLQPRHILLTALSPEARRVSYARGDRRVVADHASLALLQMLDEDQRPSHVIAIVTSAARAAAWPGFCEQMAAQLGREPEAVDVPDGRDEGEMRAILERMAVALDRYPAAAVTLDVTHGFRHFPLLAYAMGLYVHAMRGVPLRGLFHGMLLDGPGTPAPPAMLLDLQPIADLQDWVRAIGGFRETGNASAIAGMLEGHARALSQRMSTGDEHAWRRIGGAVKRAAEQVQRVSACYEAGLPLELGDAARAAIMALDGLRTTEPADAWSAGLPMAGELLDRLGEAARPFAFASQGARKGGWKREIRCHRDELARQARLIDSYLEREHLPLALGLMREWVVSLVMLARQSEAAVLVESRGRSPAEHYLGALARYVATYKAQGLAAPDEQQRRWGEFWNRLGELRNALHHHGMRVEEFQSEKRMQQIQEFWRAIADGEQLPPAFGGGDGRVLVSPQGHSPGLLYSALCNTRPTGCIVLCSEASRAHVLPAIEQAGFGGHVLALVLDDPLQGFDELKRLQGEALPYLFGADQVVANLTGGTTLMTAAVQRLVEAAKALGRPVRRFALIDHRSREEQREAPFVPSDIYWLDGEESV
jgi:CRISPR-associated DxTHG motif protein